MPKKPQQVLKQWYRGLEPMDLSGIKEKRKGAYKGYGKIGYYTRDCKSKPKKQRLNQGF